MISKIFGNRSKKDSQDNESLQLKQKIDSMNLSDMVLYVKGKMGELELTEEGIVFVLERLVSQINDKRCFLDREDDDSKLKKAFDLVVLLSKNRKITLKAMELIAGFSKQYEDIIRVYDQKNKEIYAQRLQKAIDNAMVVIEAKVALKNKMNILQK